MERLRDSPQLQRDKAHLADKERKRHRDLDEAHRSEKRAKKAHREERKVNSIVDRVKAEHVEEMKLLKTTMLHQQQESLDNLGKRIDAQRIADDFTRSSKLEKKDKNDSKIAKQNWQAGVLKASRLGSFVECNCGWCTIIPCENPLPLACLQCQGSV